MKITIVGLGLIGGSMARRLRGFHDCKICAVNRTAETLLLAKQDGVIDEGYTGEIVVKLYNNSNMDYVVRLGDKITQLVVLPLYPIKDLEIVETLEKSERGDNGFGSTGK